MQNQRHVAMRWMTSRCRVTHPALVEVGVGQHLHEVGEEVVHDPSGPVAGGDEHLGHL